MPVAGWPEWGEGIIEQARSGTSGATWERAAAIVGSHELTPEQVEFLATLGLAELAAWADRLDDDPGRACAGEMLARARYPGISSYLHTHDRRWEVSTDADR
jgi:hypothetical protein